MRPLSPTVRSNLSLARVISVSVGHVNGDSGRQGRICHLRDGGPAERNMSEWIRGAVPLEAKSNVLSSILAKILGNSRIEDWRRERDSNPR